MVADWLVWFSVYAHVVILFLVNPAFLCDDVLYRHWINSWATWLDVTEIIRRWWCTLKQTACLKSAVVSTYCVQINSSRIRYGCWCVTLLINIIYITCFKVALYVKTCVKASVRPQLSGFLLMLVYTSILHNNLYFVPIFYIQCWFFMQINLDYCVRSFHHLVFGKFYYLRAIEVTVLCTWYIINIIT